MLGQWRSKFDERQLKEIDFAVLYAEKFAHGTDGHNAKMIIAKMADMLEEIHFVLVSAEAGSESAERTRKEIAKVIGLGDER